MAHEELLTEKEMEAWTKIPAASWRTMRCRRVGPPFVKIGASVRYRREAVEAYLAARTTDTAAA